MFCIKCGANLAGEAKFCAGCGTKVVVASETAAPAKAATAVSSAPAAAAQMPAAPRAPSLGATKINGKSAAIVLVVLFVGGPILLALMSGHGASHSQATGTQQSRPAASPITSVAAQAPTQTPAAAISMSPASCEAKAKRMSASTCSIAAGVMFGPDGNAVSQLLTAGSFTWSAEVEGGACWLNITADGVVRGNSHHRSFKCEVTDTLLN